LSVANPMPSNQLPDGWSPVTGLLSLISVAATANDERTTSNEQRFPKVHLNIRMGPALLTLVLIGTLICGHASSASPTQQPGMSAPPVQPKGAPAQQLTSGEVKNQLDQKLKTEPDLQGVSIQSDVNDTSVVVSGDLQDMRQHDLVMRIAHSFHGERKIVDHTTVNGKQVPRTAPTQEDAQPSTKPLEPRK
jgi:hypothetical protein